MNGKQKHQYRRRVSELEVKADGHSLRDVLKTTTDCGNDCNSLLDEGKTHLRLTGNLEKSEEYKSYNDICLQKTFQA